MRNLAAEGCGVKVSCKPCEAELVDPDPQTLWAFLVAHTTERVEPKPGVRQEVVAHAIDIDLGDAV